MKKIGQDFDYNGKITLPKRKCDSCKQEFFFLTTTNNAIDVVMFAKILILP